MFERFTAKALQELRSGTGSVLILDPDPKFWPNLDPEFWPNLDPDPDPGLCYQF